MKKLALITGITGQDGSYLSELLLDHGYEVHGIVRKQTAKNLRASRLSNLLDKLTIHEAEITEGQELETILKEVRPSELYHLAAQSRVGDSFRDFEQTMRINVDGTYRLLRAVVEAAPNCRFYFAGSSEMFGVAHTPTQNELSPFNPVSPYAVSKLAGFYLTKMFRQAYGFFACSGIFFNHESPRRSEAFVTRKISLAAAKIKLGLQQELHLGNLDIRRDWGFAGDYVKAMWLMLQQDKPDDYVVGTGESHSLKELLEVAFGRLGLDWEKYVVTDKAFYRPAEIYELRADATKAREKLGWRPTVSFEELIRMMVDVDFARLTKEAKGV